MFYRPQAIDNVNSTYAYKKLKIKRNGEGISIVNPTPYYITLYKITMNGAKYENSNIDFMISPYESLYIKTKNNLKTVTLSTINDFGGVTPDQNFDI